ncbi:hypothetical protein HD554DRAFT_2174349 [Boletus coccyginus]|nr:hypothetical protein HD554DRAFT_2174349 [Boletus coccyginus]
MSMEIDADEEDNVSRVNLTEHDLQAFVEAQKNQCEEQHGYLAMSIVQSKRILAEGTQTWTCNNSAQISIAQGDDLFKLLTWQKAMTTIISQINEEDEECENTAEETPGDVMLTAASLMLNEISQNTEFNKDGTVVPLVQSGSIEDHLNAVETSSLLRDQRHAYDIIDWHVNEILGGRDPPQLLMVIPGEGGVGKSKTIQTVTDNFKRRGIAQWLVKSAYTGIAASLIDGKTLHVIAQIPLNGRDRSRKATTKLARFW